MLSVVLNGGEFSLISLNSMNSWVRQNDKGMNWDQFEDDLNGNQWQSVNICKNILQILQFKIS